ncbi:MAG: TetR/AcrR family transcriptional regulator [Solirubrobacteraceae bacterium]|nr:MAG: TetR/AcrR family transcriptional regulator [Solirubrobacterales bacterium]
MTIPEEVERSQRADARRNRERIIHGAREVFARDGASAQMEDVARTAGVGVGTVYRHFPTKEALITELVASKFESFGQTAREALAEDREPFEVLAGVLRRNAAFMADDGAVRHALMGAGEEVWARTEPQRREANEAFQQLVERAQRAGTMRGDFGVADIPMLMCGICATMGHTVPGFDWHRHLELVIDGLRARQPITALASEPTS